MLNSFELQKFKEQFPSFFEKLPTDLLELATSEETIAHVSDICIGDGIKEEEQVERIAYYTNFVLLGQLPPSLFLETLKDFVGLPEKTAKIISEKINEVIFSKVKKSLDDVYEQTLETTKIDVSSFKKDTKETIKDDTYREPIE